MRKLKTIKTKPKHIRYKFSIRMVVEYMYQITHITGNTNCKMHDLYEVNSYFLIITTCEIRVSLNIDDFKKEVNMKHMF